MTGNFLFNELVDPTDPALVLLGGKAPMDSNSDDMSH